MSKEPPPEAPAISAVTTRVDLLSHDVNSVDTLTECAEFAAAWAGDGNSTALKEVESYAKQLTRRNEPEKDQLRYLASAALSRYPKWPIMCLKTSAPDKWATKGEARMFNSTIVKEMGTSEVGADATTKPTYKSSMAVIILTWYCCWCGCCCWYCCYHSCCSCCCGGV